MMLANLVGYGGGYDGLMYFINDVGHYEFFKGLFIAMILMHPGVILMYLKREYETDEKKFL